MNLLGYISDKSRTMFGSYLVLNKKKMLISHVPEIILISDFDLQQQELNEFINDHLDWEDMLDDM